MPSGSSEVPSVGLSSPADGVWRAWTLDEWNKRLANHFFRRRPRHEGPVVTLLVTPDELARAASAPPSRADDVRDAFVECVRREIRRSGDLVEDASDYEWWPESPPDSVVPRFVAHLIFTCIAAAESNVELADENSFLTRLRKLTGDQLRDPSLSLLPRLWSNLANWLQIDGNSARYRSLVLPDPGGLTRIGHTVRLAFPDRRDQAELSRLLDERGLSGGEPAIPPVLRLVTDNRNRFGRRFIDAFEDFINVRAEGLAGSAILGEHRFWAAVCDASIRGRGAELAVDPGARLQLLCEPQDDTWSLFVVADAELEAGTLKSVELPFALGAWSRAVVHDDETVDEREQMDRVAREVLRGTLRLSRLSSPVEQGLLPFAEGPHGLFELADAAEIESVHAALVREELVSELVRVLDARSARVKPAAYSGWVQVDEIELRRLPTEVLSTGKLARCWQLHEQSGTTYARLVGGVRVDGGWLGAREVLPRVVSIGARNVLMRAIGGNISRLEQTGPGTWNLPAEDHVGRYELVVETEEGIVTRREIQFYPTPVTERHKLPVEPAAWLREALCDTSPLDADAQLTVRDSGLDFERLCERVAYLGLTVGEFFDGPSQAAWSVVQFGGAMLGRAIRKDFPGGPNTQVESPGARRRWRKLLLSAQGTDVEFDVTRRAVGRHFLGLATVDRPTSIPPAASAEPPLPRPAVERLVAVVAARAERRSGIPWREWRELATTLLDLRPEQLPGITRAWEECGAIDVVASARWRHLAVFPRRPELVAFRSGSAFRATLTGMSLATTRDELVRWVRGKGLLLEHRRCVSPFVPSTITLRIPAPHLLDELGRALDLPLRWLDLGFATEYVAPRGSMQEAPVGYAWTHDWPSWSLQPGSAHPLVSVTRSIRRDRPDYWTVESAGATIWTYSQNLARLWGCAAAGLAPLEPTRDRELEARHAYLPLPLARAAGLLGDALPGPDAQGYRYVFASHHLRDLLLDTIRTAFDARVMRRANAG
jgi:hypothetical protein